MRMSIFSLVLAFLFFTCTFASIETEDNVLVLTDENFQEAVKTYRILLVEFYAPWCGHCKALAPEYAKAAKKFQTSHPNFHLAKIDSTIHLKTKEKYKIQGFPTLYLFQSSSDAEDIIQFKSQRTVEGIENFLVEKTKDSIVELINEHDLKVVQHTNPAVVLGYFPDHEHPNYVIFEKLAKFLPQFAFVSTSNSILEPSSPPHSLLILKHFEGEDPERIEFSEEFEYARVRDFILKNAIRLLETFEEERALENFDRNEQVHFLVFSKDQAEYHESTLQAAKKIAKEYTSQIIFIYVPSSQSRLRSYCGVANDDLPTAMMIDLTDGYKKYQFPYKGKQTLAREDLASDFRAFASKFLKKELKPFLKSGPVEDDTNENVKVVVNKNFNQRAIKTDDDVLVYFYAPWCEGCEKVSPIYEQVAQVFKDVPTITLMKMNMDENELQWENVRLHSLPVIYLFPSGDKKNPIQFTKDFNVEDLTQFLKDYSLEFELDGKKFGWHRLSAEELASFQSQAPDDEGEDELPHQQEEEQQETTVPSPVHDEF